MSIRYRRFFFTFLLIGFLASLSFTACKKPETQKQDQVKKEEPVQTGGRIENLFGAATVNGKPAKVGQIIKSGDLIELKPRAVCDVMLQKNLSIVRLKAGARLKIKELSEKSAGLSLERGWMAGYAVRGRDIRVHTPTAIASVRGTALCMKVVNPNNVYACTCNGKIHYDFGKNGKATDSAAHHKAFHYVKAGGKITRKPGGMKFHGDEALNALAGKLGRKIDWKKAE